MAATVKPIEAKAVHLIQSGQVIVDLCSVVKELVENSLDAKAKAIEVRFKNHGIDEIEVQDNGTGIAPVNYEAIALKHHTSKLATYDDLTNLSTFGFRGEALSSLCALSKFVVTTAQAEEAPKGHRLEFQPSGKLKATSVTACQRGTTVSVSDLFQNLPVRRKELTKNIKREYGKVLGLLHAYACISTSVKFTVKNAVPKSKSMTVFATKANTTTRENIANVYGAKTLSALAELDLVLDFDSSSTLGAGAEARVNKVAVKGHISKPIFGEGRQTPDRQMFFVNGRPCGLPQIAKAINEVYRSFNVSQSPFIFADFQMDTNAYDVNVSPDKRSIFLHNANALTDALKTELTAMFDDQDQTVPHSKLETPKLPPFKQLSLPKTDPFNSSISNTSDHSHQTGDETILRATEDETLSSPLRNQPYSLFQDHFRNIVSTREEPGEGRSRQEDTENDRLQKRHTARFTKSIAREVDGEESVDGPISAHGWGDQSSEEIEVADGSVEMVDIPVRDFNARMSEAQSAHPSMKDLHHLDPKTGSDIALLRQSSRLPSSGLVLDAFNRARPQRLQPEMATITIGDKTVTRLMGSQSVENERRPHSQATSDRANQSHKISAVNRFSQQIGQFASLGTQARAELGRIEDDDADNDEAGLLGSEESEEIVVDAGLPHANEEISRVDPTDDSNQMDPDVNQESDYTVEKEDKVQEEARVAELISMAEAAATKSEKGQQRRLARAVRGGQSKESLVSLQAVLDTSIDSIIEQIDLLRQTRTKHNHDSDHPTQADLTGSNEEEKLSLTVSKSDFAGMHIVGQFNLGFILAVRNGHNDLQHTKSTANNHDELFIIDQHASDEKFNFERLQTETVVGSQRMVRPVTLDLTAVEEEILLDNNEALEKNGFVVEVDTSGDRAVGQRCQLVSLPLSKEVAFGTRDLDELIHLLSETPMLSDSSFVPRPTKVRKMFAMRACRSSIMIGKTLSKKQMSVVLQHMGEIEKPWNCPHGRPTMRHLASLDSLDSILWKEGEGVFTGSGSVSKSAISDVWKAYAE